MECGVEFIGPDYGFLSCGEIGLGRMSNEKKILPFMDFFNNLRFTIFLAFSVTIQFVYMFLFFKFDKTLILFFIAIDPQIINNNFIIFYSRYVLTLFH